MQKLTIVNVGYRSTNFWVLSVGRARMLVDLGWPGSMGQMQAELKRKDIPIREIRYGLATHYHIDHAGLGEELKRAGVPLLVVDVQTDAIPQMKQWTKPHDNYTDITPHGNVIINCTDSRALLAEIGIEGQIVHTPGHSDHCVSLLLDNGAVFTGDLTHPFAIGMEGSETAQKSWEKLKNLGATTVYPGHGPIWNLESFLS